MSATITTWVLRNELEWFRRHAKKDPASGVWLCKKTNKAILISPTTSQVSSGSPATETVTVTRLHCVHCLGQRNFSFGPPLQKGDMKQIGQL